jgi:hypothetical protein
MKNSTATVLAEIKSLHKNVRSMIKEEGNAVRTDVKKIIVEEIRPVKNEIQAVKNDMKNELKNYVTNEKFERLVTVVMKQGNELELIRKTMATKGDINRLTDQMDGIAKSQKAFWIKMHTHDYRLNEIEGTLKDHTTQLAALSASR